MRNYYVHGNIVYWEDVKAGKIVSKTLNPQLTKGNVYPIDWTVSSFRETTADLNSVGVFEASSPLEAVRIAKLLGN